MIGNYYVFDNIIPTEEQKILNDYVKSSDIEWVSVENITGQYGGKSGTHKFPAKVLPNTNCENGEIIRIIDNMQIAVTENLNLEFIKNYRWKINWTTPIEDYNPMDLLHCDDNKNHIAMVYYINNSSGGTCIFNNINGNNAEMLKKDFNGVDYNSYTLLTEVLPKAGRCVVFDGNLAHYGTYPTDGDRFIINFNFAAKFKHFQKSLI